MFTRACLSLGLLLLPLSCGLSLAAPPTLRLEIHDDAELSPKAIHQFVFQLNKILERTGSSPTVETCISDVSSSCLFRPDGAILDLWVAAASAPNVDHRQHSPMGRSFLSTVRTPYAVLSLPTVQDQAQASGVPWPIVLAYTAAHEIGHMLLGAPHSRTGLMKANWERKDFEAMSQNGLHFSEDQERAIAKRLRERPFVTR